MIQNSANANAARSAGRAATLLMAAAVWAGLFLATCGIAAGSEKFPQFKYAGGTEDVEEGCVGMLQLGQQSMAFQCGLYTVGMPYQGIELMQFRAGISREVQRMKPKWKVRPGFVLGSKNKNRYFTVVYKASGTRHVIVLDVPPDGMLPYLAEIDLKAGRRVEVQRHEDYE